MYYQKRGAILRAYSKYNKMKNTQKTPLSKLDRVIFAFMAVSIVSLAGFLISYGAIMYAVIVLTFGFYIRWFIMFCAKQDREFNEMQKQDEKARNEFFY